MTKLALTLLAGAAFATPLLAAPVARPVAFQQDGISFVGTVTDLADGTRLVSGEDANTGRDFNLRVSHGYVTGTVGAREVSYAVPQHKSLAQAVAFQPR